MDQECKHVADKINCQNTFWLVKSRLTMVAVVCMGPDHTLMTPVNSVPFHSVLFCYIPVAFHSV